MSSTIPIDLSWETEVCETYNPKEYLEKNLILRITPANLSKSAKKQFRKNERKKFQKIEAEKV